MSDKHTAAHLKRFELIQWGRVALAASNLPPELHYKIRDALDAGEESSLALSAHERPDRSALLRMAGNVAGGICANPTIANWNVPPGTDITHALAEAALGVAREIMKQIDNPTPPRADKEPQT